MTVLHAEHVITNILKPYMHLPEKAQPKELRITLKHKRKMYVKYLLSGESAHAFRFVPLTIDDEATIIQELRKQGIAIPRLCQALVIRLRVGSIPKITAVYVPSIED